MNNEMNNSSLAVDEGDMLKNALKTKKNKKDDIQHLKNKYKFNPRFTMKLNDDEITN